MGSEWHLNAWIYGIGSGPIKTADGEHTVFSTGRAARLRALEPTIFCVVDGYGVSENAPMIRLPDEGDTTYRGSYGRPKQLPRFPWLTEVGVDFHLLPPDWFDMPTDGIWRVR